MKLNILFLFVFYPLFALAQQVISFPRSEMFPESTVKTLFQDAEGYMWYGTYNGLYRYDGYTVTPVRFNLLWNEQVNCIAEPRPGMLWLGTEKGVFVLDKRNLRAYELPLPAVSRKNITCLYVSVDRTVWFGVNGILYHTNPDGKLLGTYKLKSRGRLCEVHSLSEMKDGNMLLCMDLLGLCKLDLRRGLIRQLPQGNEPSNLILRDDKAGCYWIGTWGKGVYRYVPSEGVARQVADFGADRDAGKVIAIVRDDYLHYLWVVTLDNLYAFLVSGDGRLQRVDLSGLIPPGKKILMSLLKDNKGNLWLPAMDGNSFIVNFDHRHLKNDDLRLWQEKIGYIPIVTSMYKGERDYLWFASVRGGLCLYNQRTHNFISYRENKTLSAYPLLFTSRIVGRKQSGKIWVVTENNTTVYGIRHNGDRMELEEVVDLYRFTTQPARIRTVFEDSRGLLWIGTSTDVWLYNPMSGQARRITRVKGAVTGFAETRDCVWFCSQKNGLFRIGKLQSMSGKSMLPVGFLYPADFSCMAAVQDGTLLLGTVSGDMYHFRETGGKGVFNRCRYITGPEGGKINDIRMDGAGNCWILTGRLLKKYNLSSGLFYNYGTASDRNAGVSEFQSMTSYGQMVYSGGTGGILSIDAAGSPAEKSVPEPVRISDIKVGSLSLWDGRDNGRSISLSGGRVSLGHDSHNISFSFSTLDLVNASRIQYAYRLSGVDKEWNYTKTGDNTAFYNRLSRGTYTLEVRATDGNGVWNSPVTRLTVIRLPAWYETWWAFTVWGFSGIGITALIFFLYRQKIQRENEVRLTRQVSEMKLRYYTNISHDLLTPLTTAGCVVDELEKNGTSDKRLLYIMRMNLKRLQRLLEQVLDLRKVEKGGLSLKVSSGDLTRLVRSVGETGFMPLIQRKRITFSFCSEPERIEGYFDADKMDKVLYNLYSNALKYTPDGGTVAVLLQKVKSSAVITVRDNGTGISASELPLIFKRFYDNRRTLPGMSHGIGLSLVKELVELHHGTVSVTSTLGKGSVFTVSIPIERESYSSDELVDDGGAAVTAGASVSGVGILESDSVEPAATQYVPGHKEYSLLIVEDNNDLLEVMQRLFSDKYHVYTAGNGKEALAVLAEKDIDIMVSDVMMPEMDGVALCKAVRNDIDMCHVLIVLLTARTQNEFQVEYYRAGADAYVAKPFDKDVLVSHMETLLRNRSIRQKVFKDSTTLSITPLETSKLDTAFLREVVNVVETHISDTKFGVSELAGEVNMSRSSLVRKLKKLTGQTPLEFIRNIKMKQACLLLKNDSIAISEIVRKLGYNDVRFFAKTFREIFGMTPADYRKQNH